LSHDVVVTIAARAIGSNAISIVRCAIMGIGVLRKAPVFTSIAVLSIALAWLPAHRATGIDPIEVLREG